MSSASTDCSPAPVDRLFRPEESDEELGDVYASEGLRAVMHLLKDRWLADHVLQDELHLRSIVACMFGVSPSDIVD